MMSHIVVAAPLEKRVQLSVDIIANNPSPDLEILVDRSDFLIVYNQSLQKFLPLNIPLKVRSVSGMSVDYNLSIFQLDGLCDGSGPLIPTASIDDVAMTLNQPYRFSGIENTHLLTLSFPFLSQSMLPGQCSGAAGLIAELVV